MNIEIDHAFNLDLNQQSSETQKGENTTKEKLSENLLLRMNKEIQEERDPLLNNLQQKLLNHSILIELKDNTQAIIEIYNKRMAEDAIL